MSRIAPTHRVRAASATFAIIALLPSGLSGCGGSDDDRPDPRAADAAAVRTVLGELQEASRGGDGNRICTQIFTPKLADAVAVASRTGSCAQEVKRQLFSPRARLTILDVTVNDPANATATVREANGNTATLFLLKQGGRWRIRSLQPA